MYKLVKLGLMLTIFTTQQSVADSQNDIGYEPQINGGYADLASLSEFFKDKAPMISEDEIKIKAKALKGKILLDPIISELPNFIDEGGVIKNNLTIKGIFKILQAGGKIKRDFVSSETLLGNI